MATLREYVMAHARTMIDDGNLARANELRLETPRLSVSQIGHCRRQALFEAARYHPDHPLHVDPTHPFDDYVIEILECGNLWEHQTTKALRMGFGDKLHWQKGDPMLRVGSETWSGHMDFLVEPCEEYPRGAIFEHKATSPHNFVRKDRLPYLFHCQQVLAYERLYREQHKLNYVIPTWLYYRSWNNWAELEVWESDSYIVWEGEINGRDRSGEFEVEYTLGVEMAMLSRMWTNKELPERFESPFAETFTCAWRDTKKKIARPSCKYFGVCWPELPQWPEPSDLSEWGI